VAKLGTITPHGADVYSYAADEEDMVADPLLREHLAHWGVNMAQVGGLGRGAERVLGGAGWGPACAPACPPAPPPPHPSPSTSLPLHTPLP
jgi:hypothetical protein